MHTPKNTLKDVKETIHHLQNTCCSKVQDAKEDMREAAYGAGQKMRELYDITTQETRDAQARVEKQIRRNPLKASAIAVGVGFVLGALFRRR